MTALTLRAITDRVGDQVRRRGTPAGDVGQRGLHAAYQPGLVNHCPGCGRSHWLLGRMLAECAFCATAIPFAATDRTILRSALSARGED